MSFSKTIKVSALTLLATLAGCGSEETNNPTTPSTSNTVKTQIYTSIANCTSEADVPHCQFDKGVYVLQFGPNVSQAQLSRVKSQVEQFLTRAHADVRKQFNQRSIVIGVIADEPTNGAQHEKLILKLAQNIYTSSPVLNGIELVYTDISGTDETLTTTAQQKMMQLFDYYVDGDSNTQVGAELTLAYSGFKHLINNKMGTGSLALGYLKYDECNYGNGQLVNGDVIDGTDLSACKDDGGAQVNGKEDPIHTVSKNLNPGALLGAMYEYKANPASGKFPGELKDPNPKFTGTGDLASGELTSVDYPFNWANPAFTPLNDYLNKWFFVN